jgi:hypothetical protein
LFWDWNSLHSLDIFPFPMDDSFFGNSRNFANVQVVVGGG